MMYHMSETPNEGADVCMIYLKGLKITYYTQISPSLLWLSFTVFAPSMDGPAR